MERNIRYAAGRMHFSTGCKTDYVIYTNMYLFFINIMNLV